MYSVIVNNIQTFKTDLQKTGNTFEGKLEDKIVSGDLIRVNDRQYHMIHNGGSYNIDLLGFDLAEKTLSLRVNSVKFELQLKDKYDELLHQLGLDNLATRQISDIRAPMPGMVLNIIVKEGDSVKKGDPLLVLEAMKMENIIKSPGEGIIKKIAAGKGSAVEKNQLLIQF